MNVALWIAQILLGLAFTSAGIRKLVEPIDKMAKRWVWVSDFQLPVIRGIASLETLGAIGIIVPALTRILPWLTPIAACGLILLMLGALATNIRYRLYPATAYTVFLVALAVFVAYGRFVILPF
jgi:uncharacterized membrane protein YphA (DoxX/SURF4 family)